MIAGNSWFKNYDVWTAAYPDNPDLWSWCPVVYSEKRARREIIWQYGSTYRYPNYTANSVDTNIAITDWLHEIGAITPPPTGETMTETWKVVTASLKVRSGNSTAYGQVQALALNDKIEGVFDTVSQWIDISKIIRANGSVFTPVAPAKWWCSGLPAYVEKVIVTPPPPVVDAVTLDIVLHDVKVTGDEYKAVGVKAIKTA